LKSHLVRTVNAKIRFFESANDGTALLFVHGIGCASSFDFPQVAAHPLLKGRHILLVDLLGFGYSDQPRAFSYGVLSHAETLVDFMETLALEGVTLVGHSMGGAVAIQAATLRENLVQRLILLEPNLDSGGGIFSQAIANHSEASYIAEGHANMILEAETSGSDAWATTMRSSSPLAVHRGAVSLVDGTSPSWRTQLGALAIPRTVVFGASSLPDPDVDELARCGVSTSVVPDAGHSMATDNPAGLARAISEAASAG